MWGVLCCRVGAHTAALAASRIQQQQSDGLKISWQQQNFGRKATWVQRMSIFLMTGGPQAGGYTGCVRLRCGKGPCPWRRRLIPLPVRDPWRKQQFRYVLSVPVRCARSWRILWADNPEKPCCMQRSAYPVCVGKGADTELGQVTGQGVNVPVSHVCPSQRSRCAPDCNRLRPCLLLQW